MSTIPWTQERKDKATESMRLYWERKALEKQQKQDADWNRLAGTEEFVQRCLSIHRRLPGCEFEEFITELRMPNASADAKKRLRQQLVVCRPLGRPSSEGEVYYARLKVVLDATA
jgi:hypothetical protein